MVVDAGHVDLRRGCRTEHVDSRTNRERNAEISRQ